MVLSLSPLPGDLGDGALGGASLEQSPQGIRLNAPLFDALQSTNRSSPPIPAIRPALLFRLYSENLHVRAKAKLQRDRLLSGPMIDIYVGPDKRHWSLHRNLLAHHSEILEFELSHGETDRLELPEHDPSGFELLVKWLYQGQLGDVSEFADATAKYEYGVSCHKLYLLSERFDLHTLKDLCMDQFRKALNESELVPDAEEMNELYKSSPDKSQFRRLIAQLAARQIMDPGTDRDVNDYRNCFLDNPEFAIELLASIRAATGGFLLDDPTEPADACQWHDHVAGYCPVKGKGKTKQAIAHAMKTGIQHHDLFLVIVSLKAVPARLPSSNSSAPSTKSTSRLQNLRPPPLNPKSHMPPQNQRQAPPQDGISIGPLRRRLTSPASSTIEMSKEHATASPPSPQEQKDKFRFRKVTPPRNRLPEEVQEESHPVPDDHRPSSDAGSRLPQDSSSSDKSDAKSAVNKDSTAVGMTETSPKRRIWDWTGMGMGTGRMGLMGRRPHSEWRTPTLASRAASDSVSGINGALESKKSVDSVDDFSLESTTVSDPQNIALRTEAAMAKLEGLGISTASLDPALFSQTKKSSDDLVANATPSPYALGNGKTAMGMHEQSPPPSPSPQPRRRDTPMEEEVRNTSSPYRIPKYKIALASHILSPAGKKASA